MDIKKNILDLELDNELRIELFEKYYKLQEEDSLELLSCISGMYQFSGIKILEKFLFNLSYSNNISFILKINCCKALLSYTESEDKICKWDDDDIKQNKNEFNNEIRLRNDNRQEKAFLCLKDVLYYISKKIKETSNFHINGDVSITYYIDLIYVLMESKMYNEDARNYFYEIINNVDIDPDYRYKKILNLENKNVSEKKEIITEACLLFLNNFKNFTMYRILSAQYLLQNCILDKDSIETIQKIILSFAQDIELDYDLRADAADLLLVLGTDEYKNIGRHIIVSLGNIDGNVKSVYDNKQNVHNQKIEESVKKILEVLLSFPTIKLDNNEIDFNYVSSQIYKLLTSEKYKNIDGKKCKNCNEIIDKEFCCNDCEIQYNRHNNIKMSLNRIEMDRSLYLNSTTSKILIKLYSYIQKNEHVEQLEKRLLEELEEMTGKCSSGFVSRLCNTLSGFGDLNIYVSFEDQIIACFVGRLNSYIHKISNKDSPFYNDKLYDMLNLYLKSISYDRYTVNTPLKNIIDDYLKYDRESKINKAIEYFQEQVLNEMTLNTNKFDDRKNFLLFFGTYLPNLRQELWEEFKDFVDEFIFDLTIRKAISTYEGVTNFI